jgi:hypothetical protein
MGDEAARLGLDEKRSQFAIRPSRSRGWGRLASGLVGDLLGSGRRPTGQGWGLVGHSDSRITEIYRDASADSEEFVLGLLAQQPDRSTGA